MRRGAASAFGGYHLVITEGLCGAANNRVFEVLGRVNGTAEHYVESQRWMADNSDRKTFQNPLAINYVPSYGVNSVGFCSLLVNAFLEDQFDSKRQGDLRPHGMQRLLIVRGGDGGPFWSRAQLVKGRSDAINDESRAQAVASDRAVGGVIESIKKFSRELATAAASSGSSRYSGSSLSDSSSGQPSAKSSPKNKTFVCEIYCESRNDPRISREFGGSSRDEVARYIDANADSICKNSGISNKASGIHFSASQCREK